MKFAFVVALMPFASGCILVHGLAVSGADSTIVLKEDVLRTGEERDSGERRVRIQLVGADLHCWREGRRVREDLVRRTVCERHEVLCHAADHQGWLSLCCLLDVVTIVPGILDALLLSSSGHCLSFDYRGPARCPYASSTSRERVAEPELREVDRWVPEAGPVVVVIEGVGTWTLASDALGKAVLPLRREQADNGYAGRESVVRVFPDSGRHGEPGTLTITAPRMVRLVEDR